MCCKEWLAGRKKERPPNEIQGSPGSSGVVEGKARVLKNVEELADLQEGEILVATTTSPSWAPSFVKIAGAVTDVGGPMCHAAIVCREYGLPTVVGTGKGTQSIKTGDLIRIDGDTGKVVITRTGKGISISSLPGRRPGEITKLEEAPPEGGMEEKEKRLTLWYEETDGKDFPLVGKKNANLGEMIKAGIPVSPGFAITIHANDQFLELRASRGRSRTPDRDAGPRHVRHGKARE